MPKFNHTCAICNTTLSDTRNALSLHIRIHNISKQDYYQQYVDPRTTCKGCGIELKFRNLQTGYSEYCNACGVKIKQWSGDKGEARKQQHRELIAARGGGASLGGAGARKGSKNKNPYPMSDQVLRRIEQSKSITRTYNSSPDKVNKQKTTWENKTEEQIVEFNTKRSETLVSRGFKYYQGKYTPKHPDKYAGDPTQVIYRSSWELKFFNWCDNNPAVVKWSSEETIIPYVCPTDNRVHRYFVDAKIQVKNKEGQLKTYLIEIKPDIQTRPPVAPKRKTKRYLQEVMTWGKNDAKWKAAREFCADRGYEFMILTEHHLGLKKSP